MSNSDKSMDGKTKKKKRRTRKKKRRILSMLGALLSFAAVAGAIIAATVIFFKITDISVHGSTVYPTADIIGQTSLKVGNNMFAFDKFAIIEKIKKNFPFIKEVRIDRKLPNKILITVEEYQPAAYVMQNDDYWLISSDGKVLKHLENGADSEEISACAQVAGIEVITPETGEILEITEKDKKKPLLDILQTVEKSAILKKVSKIDVTKLYRITMSYDGRFEVRFGSADDLDKKMSFLSAVEQQLLPTDEGIIDLSDTKQARFIPSVKQDEQQTEPESEIQTSVQDSATQDLSSGE